MATWGAGSSNFELGTFS